MIPSTKVLSREYLTAFLDAYEYEADAKEALLSALDKLMSNNAAKEKMNAILAEYVDDNFDYSGCFSKAKAVLKEAEVGEYPGTFIFVAHLSSTMRQLYAERGIPDSIWFDTMRDLKYKAKECLLVKKQWGTFVGFWYAGFFRLKIYALGRLQFDQRKFETNFTVDGIDITTETPVLYIHIPRSEEPLTPESAHKAYEMAKEFFKEKYFGGGPCIFCCSSWLLYPEHKNMLKPEANICRFMDDFTTVISRETTDFAYTWRLFDTEYTGDPDALPADTTLRRAYIERMKKGLPLGSALGVFII